MSKREARLVLRAQCGDRDALDELLTILGPGLKRYLTRLSSREDIADDLVQETMLIICRKLNWLREPELIRSWSYRIASRLAFRRLKKERQNISLDDETITQLEDPQAESKIRARLETISTAKLIETLPAAARATLWLHYVQGLTLSEVAEVLELAPGTVRSRLSYGLSKLREHQGEN